ncbi:FeoA family protein [Desulfotomaculum copahuensis]|uniref:Ferrous iron transporter FeoA-like domain-containing protein n=1 Tax=Desulfotomaculum copahuensis TaxID=1838280 RepID=A0A1B7LHA6_9FIRM|nr:FeoA family protein [Desulfotomaculum copahuensis]OAT85498.1 hypothetical protein A6M21_06180 [Desulfotomaculum copahuensis]
MPASPRKCIDNPQKSWPRRILGLLFQTDSCRCGEGNAGPGKECSCTCNKNHLCATREWMVEQSSAGVPDGLTLNTLPAGGKARIEQLYLPPALKKRLLSMGLTGGTEIAVINKEGGRMIIAVRDSRLGLSPEMAARITCKPA